MSQNILKRGIKILLKKMPYCGKIIREREQMAHLPGQKFLSRFQMKYLVLN